MSDGQRQYIRRCNLFVAGLSGDGLDLSNLHVKFELKKADSQSPNAADITVYNLAPDTAQKIRKEFSRVILQAGYDANYGVIFDGTIKQVRIGRENGTDTYLNIAASDGDVPLNFAVVNTTLAAGSTRKDRVDAALAPMTLLGMQTGYVDVGGEDQKLSRGKPMFGMSRDYLRGSAIDAGATYSIQEGRLQFLPRTAVVPGKAIAINSKTGMVGSPEQTTDGVKVRCLLNPLLRIGGIIKLNEGDVQEAKLFSELTQKSSAKSSSTSDKKPAALSTDGSYRLLLVDAVGDTRGNEWYSELTCLDVDASAPTGEEVSAE